MKRNFKVRIIAILVSIMFFSSCVTNKDLEYIYTILQDALEECGVTLYNPKIGESIRNLDGLRENAVQITTEDKEKEYTIARVIEAGYKIDSDGKPEMIRHAKVEVYVPK